MTTDFASRVATILLAVFLAWPLPAGADDADLRAGVFSPARAAPDFMLKGSDGAELTLARYRGKMVILEFGFTSCTKVCPTTLATLASARKQLGADAADVQVVYVTVDPERDTPLRMHDYLAVFDATFVGGTGTPEQLAAVRKDYGIFANKEEADGGYAYSHSSYTYLIDREGELRALMPYGKAPDDYVHDARILLRAASPVGGQHKP